jgi:23S rRNA pseudouridine2605 synthase
MGKERLQKYMAECGVASRRASEAMIRGGRVRVNGVCCREMGTQIDPQADIVEVDGKHIHAATRPLFYLMNKPAGYLTTTRDPGGRPTIFDLAPELRGKVNPVGRLDRDTEGLLLLTNHGQLAYRLTHPRYQVPKTYIAQVSGVITHQALDQLARGVALDDGTTAPAKARFLKKQGKNSTVELIIHEGKKREVRRMLDAVGFPVLRLRRVSMGGLRLTHVDLGEVRPLTDREVGQLFDRVQLSREDLIK